MARTLPFGRLTKSDDSELTEAIRQAGTIAAFGNNGIFGNILDRLFFESHGVEHILGSAAQVAADYSTITWDQVQQRFEDKAGSEVVLADYDRVAVIGMDTLTDNMVIDNIVGLEMFHIGNTPGQSGSNPRFQLGDAGGGEPYRIKFGPDTSHCKINIWTDKDFRDMLPFTYSSTPTDIQKSRYIVNQGIGNRITVNDGNKDFEIYNPSEAGTIVKLDTLPINPYLIRMNGQILRFATSGGSDTYAWFRDINIALDGYRLNGSDYIETESRFSASAFGSLFQVNNANRFLTDVSALDTRIHERTDPTGVSVAKTVNFDGTNLVTFQGGLGQAKNGMRIQGGAVPGGTGATTIVRNLDISTGTGRMFNALTGAAVNVGSATGVSATLDNSGAAGGSHDVDYFQGHLRDIGFGVATVDGVLVGPAFTGPSAQGLSIAAATAAITANRTVTKNYLTDGSYGTPRPHDQNQPITSGAYHYYRA